VSKLCKRIFHVWLKKLLTWLHCVGNSVLVRSRKPPFCTKSKWLKKVNVPSTNLDWRFTQVTAFQQPNNCIWMSITMYMHVFQLGGWQSWSFSSSHMWSQVFSFPTGLNARKCAYPKLCQWRQKHQHLAIFCDSSTCWLLVCFVRRPSTYKWKYRLEGCYTSSVSRTTLADWESLSRWFRQIAFKCLLHIRKSQATPFRGTKTLKTDLWIVISCQPH
jgi:hypothetical protein